MDALGLLNICKVPGMSSHEVVARTRRILGMKRIGHTGTLDPSACGVLPVCVGSATRLADYIAVENKSYRAEIVFGLVTDSADAEGEVMERVDAQHLDESTVLPLLSRFLGTIDQIPPRHSAVQVAGLRAYDMARRGEEFEMPTRKVTIYALTPIRFVRGIHPRLLLDITCARGTYIRSLARDIGVAAGVGGTLGFLARTRVGKCHLEESVTLEELAVAAEDGTLDRWLLPADAALEHLPIVSIPDTADRYRHGTAVPCTAAPHTLYRVYLRGQFVGLGRVIDDLLYPVVNLQ